MHGWDPLIGSHAVAATLAVVLGALQLARRRFGDRLHRWNGRAWVVLALYVAVTSFWIRDLRPGSFSWIHILSVITIVSIVAALVAVPTRLVPRSLQADWTGMTLLTAVLVAAALGGVGLLSFAARRLRRARVR